MREELLKALKTIQEECQSHEEEGMEPQRKCMDCPMCGRYGCLVLYEYPSWWELPEE